MGWLSKGWPPRCTSLHFAALRCTSLHFAALRCTLLHFAAHRCTSLHCHAAVLSTSVHFVAALRCASLRFTALTLLCFAALHCTYFAAYTSLHFTALRCTATALRCSSLHCHALPCTVVHCHALLCTSEHCCALLCTAMHCCALLSTAVHYQGARELLNPQILPSFEKVLTTYDYYDESAVLLGARMLKLIRAQKNSWLAKRLSH